MRRDAQDITDRVAAALNTFAIELPSWGFADTGTRFGKFLQPAAATTIDEKLADAGQCTRSPVLPDGRRARPVGSAEWRRRRCASEGGCSRRRADRRDQPEPLSGPALQVRLVRQPHAAIRDRAVAALPRRIAWRAAVGSRDLSLWFADGSNYPGTATSASASAGLRRPGARARGAGSEADDARRVQAVRAGVLSHRHRRLGHGAAASARPGRAKVLVDTGHHYTRRTSSRSSRGCSTKTCSAASTSTTASTPTTI